MRFCEYCGELLDAGERCECKGQAVVHVAEQSYRFSEQPSKEKAPLTQQCQKAHAKTDYLEYSKLCGRCQVQQGRGTTQRSFPTEDGFMNNYEHVQSEYDNMLPSEGGRKEPVVCPNCGEQPEFWVFRSSATKEILCCDMCAERVDKDVI